MKANGFHTEFHTPTVNRLNLPPPLAPSKNADNREGLVSRLSGEHNKGENSGWAPNLRKDEDMKDQNQRGLRKGE